jgi:2-polyprenyl-3-methyl-5-hydroxy-6-metoxy-1,4-benzoquinol methylase
MKNTKKTSDSENLDSQLPSTGERLLTQSNNQFVTVEHLHRYAFAMEYVNGKNVLDIASGEGYGSNLLASVAREVVGVDISQEAINFASQKYTSSNLIFKVGSADLIPLPDNAVDIVVSFETLEHHDKHEEMMSEIHRVLKPDGLLIMSTPDKSLYHRRDPNNIYHVKELNFEEFKHLIEKTFKQSIFIDQQIIFGSLLSLKCDKSSQQQEKISFYSGDFNKINPVLDRSQEFISQPFYTVCIASDIEIWWRYL